MVDPKALEVAGSAVADQYHDGMPSEEIAAIAISAYISASIPAEMGEPPICAPIHPATDEIWKHVIELFERHGLQAPPVRLRDEIVGLWDWALYGERAASVLLSLSARVGELEKALDIAVSRGCDHCSDSISRARAALTHPAPTHNDGSGEAVAWVCEADLKLVAERDGYDISVSPRARPEYGMKMPLYTRPAHTSGEGRTCATCHAVLASGPQPQSTYEATCVGADDPEERCPRHPRDCVCWKVDMNHPTVTHPAPTHNDAVGVRCDVEAERHAEIDYRGYSPIDAATDRCSDCPPVGYPTDETRCATCDRASHTSGEATEAMVNDAKLLEEACNVARTALAGYTNPDAAITKLDSRPIHLSCALEAALRGEAS